MEDSYEKRKTLQELTIKDNFLFGAVMVNEENCKEFLEMVLEIEIDQVKVSKEKSIVYHPEYKGVRLDVYARDEEHTHYNIEMQAEKKPVLGKRSRYYQSQMDMELLMSGEDYTELPNTYVIFCAISILLKQENTAIPFSRSVRKQRKHRWKTDGRFYF